MDTYDEILGRMVESYREYSGFAPSEESDIMIRLRVLAGEIYQEQAHAEYIKRQVFPSTAEGEYLELHAAERGLSRKPAVAATGTVSFYPADESHTDILIPVGTVVCTGADMRRFVTDSDVLLESGSESVSANVTAAAAGADYNVLSGTVSIIVTPVTGIGGVSNASAFSGGEDEESDDQLRQRIIDSYINISNGANEAYYKGLAMSVTGVYSASVVGRGRGSGTVDVYISSMGSTVSAAVKTEVQALMDSGRELNTDVLVRDPSAAQISLYIRLAVEPGYAFADVSSQVQTAVSGYINALGIGGDVKLSKIGGVIRGVKGVGDYHFLESYGSDRSVSDTEYPVTDTITIVEA